MEEIIMEAQNLTKHFQLKMGFFKTLLSKEIPVVHAVDDVSFQIKKKEIFGLVGESGCGKTTTGRLLLRLIEPTAGKVIFEGKDITSIPENEMRKLRRKLQIIFQDPYESLNPRMTIFDIVSEPLRIQNAAESEEEILERVVNVMENMDLIPPEQFLYRFPHELSGGQRQRVAIARAFALEPKFIVADEPVSMLDASIRTEVTKLILNLVERFHVSFLYITHDIALTRYICNRIAVMYLGRIVEQGPVDDVIQNPRHPYTMALIAAVPVPDPTAKRTKVVLKGEVPSPVNIPPGCRFHTRCPYAKEICRKEEPQLIRIEKDRYVACHFPLRK
ncbi:oligopeptide ABC transporter ATP-binding protein [Candidatus Bathyarchaeota archaeon]|nr:MAG: oligopeptide ABC transporter ATP-binding protein [Candidatus Bathyarchaeota archaeon]